MWKRDDWYIGNKRASDKRRGKSKRWFMDVVWPDDVAGGGGAAEENAEDRRRWKNMILFGDS